MRLLYILILLISSISFAQPLVLSIESITSKDSLPNQREFTVKYFVKNNTNDTLRFFLDTKSINPSTGGSMSQAPYYKIYEDHTFIEVGQIFKSKGTIISMFKTTDEDSINSEEEYHKKYIEYLSERYKPSVDSLKAVFKEQGLDGLMRFEGLKYFQLAKSRKWEYQVLPPNEQIHCNHIFYWDKQRYYYKEPNEYYLNENAKHYLELTLVALKEEFKNMMKPEVFEKIMKLPNFIKGVFVSNKVEINLKE